MDNEPAAPALVLLHGLAATGAVWSGLADHLADRWPGPWFAPDLPGHGQSPPPARYTFGALAARVAEQLDPDRPVVVLGHSLGGVVALALASGWFGVPVVAAAGLGIKVSWSDTELAKAGALAAKPPKVFETRAEAETWAAKLAGVRTPLPHAVAPAGAGWRAAVDPAAFGVGRPDLPGLLAAARCPVTLAAGEHDPMAPADHLRTLTGDPLIIGGQGHNAHVDAPGSLHALMSRLGV